MRSVFAAITPPLVPQPSALRETAETVAAQAAAGGGLVAEAAGAIIGVILWGDREGGLYLGRLSVADPWRRTGVAGRWWLVVRPLPAKPGCRAFMSA